MATVFVKPKFGGGSWSILGGLGMLLTIAAPYISAWTGIDITPEVIEGGSAALDGVVKGLAGAIGFAVLVFGRIRAGKTLQPITFNPAGADPLKVEVSQSLGTAVAVPVKA